MHWVDLGNYLNTSEHFSRRRKVVYCILCAHALERLRLWMYGVVIPPELGQVMTTYKPEDCAGPRLDPDTGLPDPITTPNTDSMCAA